MKLSIALLVFFTISFVAPASAAENVEIDPVHMEGVDPKCIQELLDEGYLYLKKETQQLLMTSAVNKQRENDTLCLRMGSLMYGHAALDILEQRVIDSQLIALEQKVERMLLILQLQNSI